MYTVCKAAFESIKVKLDSDTGPLAVMVNQGWRWVVCGVVAHVGGPLLVYNSLFLNSWLVSVFQPHMWGRSPLWQESEKLFNKRPSAGLLSNLSTGTVPSFHLTCKKISPNFLCLHTYQAFSKIICRASINNDTRSKSFFCMLWYLICGILPPSTF